MNKKTIKNFCLNTIWRILPIILIVLLSFSSIYQINQYQIIKALQTENQLLELEFEEKHRILKNPDIKELKEFLESDQTDEVYPLMSALTLKSPYHENVTTEFKHNAQNMGYNMCLVTIDVEIYVGITHVYRMPWGSIYTDYYNMSFISTRYLNGVILDNGTFVYINPISDLIIEKNLSDLESAILDQIYSDIYFSVRVLFFERKLSEDDNAVEIYVDILSMLKELHIW